MRTVGALLLGVAVASAPALTYAQHSFGGGGGGHFSGGGGHFGGGAHFSAPHMAAPHFAGGPHAYGGPHFASAGHFAYGGGIAPHAGLAGAPHFAAHAGFVPHAGAGWAAGNGYWHGGHYWGGGYWHGAFWPHVWFNPGFAWFLPVLPLGYATFWWGGLPYYYWNNVYYTWNPGYNGYVVTDPPPVAGQNADTSSTDPNAYEQAPESNDAAPAPYTNGTPPVSGGADVFLYPRNGQSDAQQQSDRYECHSWAVHQVGFDPTQGGQQSGSAQDYRRAMIACLDARGYSAR
jgi:hypothetical protein